MFRVFIASMTVLLGCVPAEPSTPPPEETTALTPTMPGFFAEGLAWDPDRGRLLIGGIVGQSIAAVAVPGGEVETFATPPDDWSVFGVAYDPTAKLVWAAASAVSQGRTLPEPIGPAGLIAFAADDGRLVTAAVLDDGEPHLFGDLVVTPDVVFATDTLGGGVYRTSTEGLEVVAPPKTFRSPQGLVMVEGALIVSDYSQGLMRLDPETGVVAELAGEADLRGIDGLAVHGRGLAAVQNGAQPPRVLRVELSADGTAVDSAEVFVVPEPAAGEPTLATFVGDTLWIMQTDFWPRVFDQDVRPRSDVEVAPPTVLRLPWDPSGG